MAAMEEAIRSRLLGGAAVASLVGTRMYPLVVPQAVDLPAIAYYRVSSFPIMAHDGAVGLTQARLQLTLVGRGYTEAKELADAVRARLNGFRGVSEGVTLDAVTLTDEADEDMPDSGSQPLGEGRVVFQDYFVMYRSS